jgi:Fe-S oxidoreductase
MRLSGLTALPLLPPRPLKAEARRLGVAVATQELIEGLPEQEKKRAVVFVADAFTAHFDPGVALSAISLARKMGLIPYLAEGKQNGKAMHVHGYLGRFEANATKTARYLQDLAAAGATLVGLDPSMTLVYRSEYKGLWGNGVEATVLLPQEWLAANLDRLSAQPQKSASPVYSLLPHCTERSNAPSATAQWKTVFKALGIPLEIASTGCCGMAGTFGHEVRNRATSEALYAMSWSSHIAGTSSETVTMATGYSCRSQVKAIDTKSIPHPLAIIDALTG